MSAQAQLLAQIDIGRSGYCPRALAVAWPE